MQFIRQIQTKEGVSHTFRWPSSYVTLKPFGGGAGGGSIMGGVRKSKCVASSSSVLYSALFRLYRQIV